MKKGKMIPHPQAIYYYIAGDALHSARNENSGVVNIMLE